MSQEPALRVCPNCSRGVLTPFLRGKRNPTIYLCRNCGMEYRKLPSLAHSKTIVENPLSADLLPYDDEFNDY